MEFEWTKTDTVTTHEWQATDVTGIGGGKLMCETRNDTRQHPRPNEDGDNSEVHTNRPPRRIRGGGPREDKENMEWRLVKVRRGNTRSSDQDTTQDQSQERSGKREARPRGGDDV